MAVSTAASAQGAVRGDRVDLVGGGTLPVGHSNVFGGNDDAFTGPHDLGFELNFFGTTHTQAFVSNNGYITFGAGSGVFTPFALQGNLGQLFGNPNINGIIAPFFSDVDTRGALRSDAEFVGGTRPAAVGLTSFAAYSAADNFGGIGHDVFSVTWSDVGYFGIHRDKTNTFQLNLIDREDTGFGLGNFDIEFNYDNIDWETGDASGGSGGFGGEAARAGYSAGTGVAGTFTELFGSGQPGAFLDANANSGLIYNSVGSNVPGRFVFQVRNAGGGVPGESQGNPELPNQVIPGPNGPTYVFRGFGSGRWADPPDTYGFLYEGVGGTLFPQVGLPTGFDPFDVCWGVGFASCVNDVAAGTIFDFLANAGGPVDAFEILGIDPLVDSSNPLGFPTQMFFTTPTGDFNMTALTVSTSTPEPGTWMLLGGGLVALWGVRRRRVAHAG